MDKFKNIAIKYTILLVVIFILQPMFPVILQKIALYSGVVIQGKDFLLPMILFDYFFKLIFAFILFRDCRNEIENFILVPLICIFSPVAGLLFYFTAVLFETRKQIQ